MSHFDQVKRDPWMTEQHYKASTAAKEAEFADRDISDLLTDPLHVARHNKGLSWDHAYMALELAIQRYSGGEPLELVDTYVDYAFIQFQRHFDAYPTADAQLRPWVRDEYQYILWLLALAVLFGYPQRIEWLLSWINRDDERGHDALLHRLFDRVEKTFAGKTLIHPQPYSTLLETLDLRSAEQRQHLSLYLKHWYGGLQGCYWHGRHGRARGDHIGYWAFEAALVALLWKIDDASIGDTHHYPKALLDKARDRKRGDTYPDEETLAWSRPTTLPSGALCPWPGYYVCVERMVGEQPFMHNTPFPKIENEVVHWQLSRTFNSSA